MGGPIPCRVIEANFGKYCQTKNGGCEAGLAFDACRMRLTFTGKGIVPSKQYAMLQNMVYWMR